MTTIEGTAGTAERSAARRRAGDREVDERERSPIEGTIRTAGAVLARAQGNVVSLDARGQDVREVLATLFAQAKKSYALDASIRLRLPYIEPLNLLQIELMKRHRAGEDDPRIGEGILLSINAIATALRNSG